MKKHFKKAIKYVRENKTWSDAAEEVAIERIDLWRCPLEQVDESISNEIAELMDEYGEENDLSEGWWREYGEEDDIFFKL